MKLSEYTWWIRIRESMWAIPSALVAAAFLLALGTLALDENFGPTIARWLPWVFHGGPEAARVVLGTIAGAMATVVGMAFSITVVVFQLAAGQYSPRVITTFRKDRGQQVVLGTYLGTFVYALLVIRDVRGTGEGITTLIPGLSIFVASMLAVVSLGMLIYFVHHISEQLRVSDIAARIHQDLVDIGEDYYPGAIGQAYDAERDDAEVAAELRERAASSLEVEAGEAGYLRKFDGDKAEDLFEDNVVAVEIYPRIGDFVFRMQTVAVLYFGDDTACEHPGGWRERLQDCLNIGSRPNIAQNPGLGIKQLVDIALRALSPGVNDPTTAEQVLGQIGDWMSRLANTPLPSMVRRTDHGSLILPRPSFAEHVGDGFDQIRRSARPLPHVIHTLLDIIDRLVDVDLPKNRLAPLRAQVEAVERGLSEADVPDPEERREIRSHVARVLAKMRAS